MYLNIPIQITLLRIMLIPFFMVAFYLPFSWNSIICAIIFSFSAITDWCDGFLARRLKQITSFGRFLDPVADKIMLVIALTMISDYFHKWIITFPVSIMIAREIIISALREWLSKIGKRKNVEVSYISKIKTTIQMISIFLLLWHPGILIEWIGIIFLYISSILTFWSMIQYLYITKKIFNK